MQKWTYAFILSLFSFNSYTQILVGDWKGVFNFRDEKAEIPIALSIRIDDDTSYIIYSSMNIKDSKGNDSNVVTKFNLTFEEHGLLVFTEIPDIKLSNSNYNFKKMYLLLSNAESRPVLRGAWKMEKEICPNSGQIFFLKNQGGHIHSRHHFGL
jgi:hypothetical protein